MSVDSGPLTILNQSFWQVMDARMPILESAMFQSIVGLGPPGQPIQKAEATLTSAKSMVNKYRKFGLPVPPKVKDEMQKSQTSLEHETHKEPLLTSLGTKVFSTCLGRAEGSDGYLIWNDRDPKQQPWGSAFRTVDVSGNITWGLELQDMTLAGGKLNGSQALGCSPNCGAIVDTGTSLIAVSSDVYMQAVKNIQKLDTDCSNLAELPELKFKLGGMEFALPPEGYIGEVVGLVPPHMKHYMHTNEEVVAMLGVQTEARSGVRKHVQPFTVGSMCQLLLMDMGTQETQFGPMMILGMPWFREYYTTFDLGDGSLSARKIHVAKSDENCNPVSTSSHSLLDSSTHMDHMGSPRRPRRVEASKLRMPQWLEQMRRQKDQVVEI